VLTKQGKTSHWLYIIVSGEAEIVQEKPDGTRLRVGSVVAGGFFGEMGLLTGAPRTATVIATTDVECYRLDKDSFQGLLTSRPELAEDISRIVAERQQNNAVTNAAAAAEGQQDARGDLLAGIRKFFGLAA
jgi:CRP-like cAMP-binding protein